MGEAFITSKGQYGEDGEERIFAKPAHIVQNNMRSSHQVEYPLNDEIISRNNYKVIMLRD